MRMFSILLIFFFQNSMPELMRNVPSGPGVYFLKNGTEWGRLSRAPIVEVKSKDLDAFILTSGYVDFEIKIACSGAKAAARIANPKPVFFIREVGSAKELMLIQLSSKKNKRTFDMVSSAATVENKGGFNKKSICKMKVTQYPDGSFSATPEKDLKAGEYLLVFGIATLSFDFGVDEGL